MFPTEFEFVLPKGYLDNASNLHRHGLMRLATAMDEVTPLRDPRVKANPAYATVIILSRVITQLGALEDVTPAIIEGLFACDLNYLYQFYRRINELENELEADAIATEPETGFEVGAIAHNGSHLSNQ
jgi:hypothetical protein